MVHCIWICIFLTKIQVGGVLRGNGGLCIYAIQILIADPIIAAGYDWRSILDVATFAR